MYLDYKKGKGAQINTKNPFRSQEINYDIDPYDGTLEPKPTTRVYLENPKKLVNKVSSPDLGMMFSANPYQGCEHGCSYCYARNTHEYWGFSAGLDFESNIIVKKNAPSLLEKYLLKKDYKVRPISFSGNTDCYQPIEKKLQITRKCLEVCAKYRHPVGIITKNQLIQRDFDLLKNLAQDNLVHVYFSINTVDEKLRSVMEPRTASANAKLKVLEKFSSAQIPCGVMIAPIIPGLNHHEIPCIMQQIANAGALSVGYTVVRLNGRVKEIFKDWLDKNFPTKAAKVWNQIAELHGGQQNDNEWGRRVHGEGPIAHAISCLFKISKRRFMHDRKIPAYNLDSFRKGGSLTLF